MTSIKEFNNQQLSEIELKNIRGGGLWSYWKVINTDPISGVTIQQRINWFGLNGTDDTKTDCDPMI